jgi:hypothetical protein
MAIKYLTTKVLAETSSSSEDEPHRAIVNVWEKLFSRRSLVMVMLRETPHPAFPTRRTRPPSGV